MAFLNDKGQPAKQGDKLRVRPLEYIRSKVHGRARGAGFLAMQHRAGDKTYQVFGLFQKFLEIAGCESHEHRGQLLNARGKPATITDLAFILGASTEQVEHAMQILTDNEVGWISEVDNNEFQEFQENLESHQNRPVSEHKQHQIPEIPGKSGALYNRTEPNRTETEPNGTQPNHARARAREGLVQCPATSNPNGNDSSAIARAAPVSASARLDFGHRLRVLLGNPGSNSDTTALWNLQNWADKQMDDGTHDHILEIARDLKGSRNKMAVFFTRVGEQLGYRARAEKDKDRHK